MNKDLHPVRSPRPETVLVPWSFTANGTDAIDQTTITSGAGVTSVTYGATGIYTVVFDANMAFPVTPQVWLTLLRASVADTDIDVTSWTQATRTLVLTSRTAGSAAALAAGTVVNVAIAVCNKGATP